MLAAGVCSRGGVRIEQVIDMRTKAVFSMFLRLWEAYNKNRTTPFSGIVRTYASHRWFCATRDLLRCPVTHPTLPQYVRGSSITDNHQFGSETGLICIRTT